MAAIITQKVGNHTYLYESESYRENGKVRNRRKCVGKVDPLTGNHIFKPEYIKEKGLHLTDELATEADVYSVSDVKNSIVKEYGVFYLLNEIARVTGLSSILAEVFPDLHEEVLNLAFFMVSTGEPAMYCEDWLYKTEHYPGRELSSQRISEILSNITNGERLHFFERWGDYRSEKEYIALDTTSISTYSELINNAEWGYNRDKEKLPQVNVCMLMGEKSKLPILQVVYNGSIGDVSTLINTLRTASNLNLNNMSLVMDKGFAKISNINKLLSKEAGIRFLIALPFNMKFAKAQVTNDADRIDCAENTVVIGSDVLRGVTSRQMWNEDNEIIVHTFYNPVVAAYAKNNTFSKIKRLTDAVMQNPTKYQDNSEAKKYLSLKKSTATGGFTVSIKEKAISNELLTKGWVVIAGNHIDNAQEALEIYRAKDVVEKGFLRMKSCLDLARLRVHSDETMQSKIFIGFIALIITAHIHKTMSEKLLYKSWTMKKMLKILERLKIHYIKNDQIISPLTKDQKRIFSAFDMKPHL